MDGASGKDRTQLDTCKRGPPLIKLMGYELRNGTVGCEGSRQWQTHTCTHTHIQCPSWYTGWMEHRKGSDAILTVEGVVCLLIKLVGYEHYVNAVVVG